MALNKHLNSFYINVLIHFLILLLLHILLLRLYKLLVLVFYMNGVFLLQHNFQQLHDFQLLFQY